MAACSQKAPDQPSDVSETAVRDDATVEPTKMPDSHDAFARARS